MELSSLPLLSEETVLTEKMDGANCSIYHGNVSDMCMLVYMDYILITVAAI